MQTTEFSAMVHRMNASSASLQEMLDTPSSTPVTPTNSKLSMRSRQFDWILKRNSLFSGLTQTFFYLNKPIWCLDSAGSSASRDKLLQSILKSSSSKTPNYFNSANKTLQSILKPTKSKSKVSGYSLRNRRISFRLPSPTRNRKPRISENSKSFEKHLRNY
jgi:hypothetical protein